MLLELSIVMQTWITWLWPLAENTHIRYCDWLCCRPGPLVVKNSGAVCGRRSRRTLRDTEGIERFYFMVFWGFSWHGRRCCKCLRMLQWRIAARCGQCSMYSGRIYGGIRGWRRIYGGSSIVLSNISLAGNGITVRSATLQKLRTMVLCCIGWCTDLQKHDLCIVPLHQAESSIASCFVALLRVH